METVNCLIIGGGPAGYTAAIYASRADLAPVVYEGIQPGGQLTTTTDIENYPGFENGISGQQLMETMKAQAVRLGADIRTGAVTDADLSQRPFKIVIDGSREVFANSLIIATGATAKYLGLPSEIKYRGLGVSACATCDGFFFRDKEVFVIGGGNTAVYEALHLSTVCKKVTVIHRRDHFTAEHINQKHLFETPNISVIWNSTLDEIIEDEEGKKVRGIKVKNIDTNEITEYETEGVFIAIGNKPNTELVKGKIELDDSGYIKSKPNLCATNIDGVFAAGDVKNPHFKQVVIAAASGAQAAMEATTYLISQE